jgi:hypothetical protein
MKEGDGRAVDYHSALPTLSPPTHWLGSSVYVCLPSCMGMEGGDPTVSGGGGPVLGRKGSPPTSHHTHTHNQLTTHTHNGRRRGRRAAGCRSSKCEEERKAV